MAKRNAGSRESKPKAPKAPGLPASIAVPIVSAPAAAPVVVDGHLRAVVVDVRLVGWLAALGIAFGAVWLVREVLLTLLFVCVLTFLCAPVVRRLERRMPVVVAAGIAVTGVVLLIAALLSLVIPPLVIDIARLAEGAPNALVATAALLETNFGIVIPTGVKDFSGEALRELAAQLSPFAQQGGAMFRQGALSVLRGAASAAGFAAQAALVPIITFFVLSELAQLKGLGRTLLPQRALNVTRHYVPLVNSALSGLVRGQLTVAAIMAVLYVVGLGLSGVPGTLAISILAGAAYLVPFASATVALILSVAFSALELGNAAVGPVVGAVITCIVIQIIEGYVLTPRILGEQAGLSPLATLLAVLLGGAAAGFVGVLFAIPVGAIVALILREEARRRGGFLVTAAPRAKEAP